jgi:uncharacterized protein YwqG
VKKGKIKELSRPAIIMDIGGFRPPDDPLASWFGKVNMALADEEWPQTNGQPMHALCQLNLLELPYKPALLADLAMLTIFIGPTQLPVDEPNGTNWCLRAYPDLSILRPLSANKGPSPIKAFPMRARAIDHDYPCLDDAESNGIEIDDADEFQERYPNAEGFKLAGWPTLIQSQVGWDTPALVDGEPQFAFQIGSCEKAHWQWGAGGVGYFGRCRTADDIDEWALSWQCY